MTLFATTARAAEWNGSYAADGRCYCSGTLDPAISSRIVPTPLGGQSVAKVCARIGAGPGLSEVGGRFDRVVYTDAQCGHGPGPTDARVLGAEPRETSCTGTMEPGRDDCHATGPRWDLAGAYATSRRRAVETSVSLIEAGVMGAPAATPVMGAAAPESGSGASDPDVRIVEIDGRRWGEAPAGTPETGPPGTRIVLDGKVFLDLELADREDFLPRSGAAPSAAAARPKPARATAASPTAPAPIARTAPSDKEVRARRERLLAEARERLRERRLQEAAKADVADAGDTGETRGEASSESVSADPGTGADRPSLGAANALPGASDERSDAAAEAAPDLATTGDEGTGEEATGDTTADLERRTGTGEGAIADNTPSRDEDAVEQSADVLADGEAGEASSPFVQALRMPVGARASSREFGYVDAMPASWEYGGGGLMLEGSAAVRGRFRALARIGAATDYQEFLLGGSWFLTPPSADRMTVVLTGGIETGRFELDGVRGGRRVGAELSDTGLYLGAASRFVVNRRFELQAGLGYSTFFEGDPTLFGGGYFHVGRQLDIVSRVEVGDNDSLGIGVRYYY